MTQDNKPSVMNILLICVYSFLIPCWYYIIVLTISTGYYNDATYNFIKGINSEGYKAKEYYDRGDYYLKKAENTKRLIPKIFRP